MKLAMIWVGHVRTFHRVRLPTVENLLEPLGVAPGEARHFLYTYPARQCLRNRPNDPPADYSAEDALEHMTLALRPEHVEIREASARADAAVAEVRARRRERGPDWTNLEALTMQYVRRTEAWEDFAARVPGWRSLDAIVFNRPDVFLYDKIAPPAFPLADDEIHVYTSLGPRKDATGLDDRWALGSPSAIESYMRVGDSVVGLLADEGRPWCPEENNRTHAERRGLKVRKLAYQGWPAWAPHWEKGHVGIARFQEDDGRTLTEALRRERSSRGAP